VSDYAKKPQRYCTFMNSASGHVLDHDISQLWMHAYFV
jgi:hypothetical protein